MSALRVVLCATALPLLAACGGGGGDEALPAPEPVAAPAPAPQPPVAVDEPPAEPPEDPPPVTGFGPPSQNFDLSHWKLTLPSALEVKTPVLTAGYELADVFYTDPQTGGMVFRTPNIGGTTANSVYSRTELREMLAPGGPAYADANNWTPERGGVLRATLRVDHVSTTGDPVKAGRLIIGQIHAPVTEVVRLYYEKRPGVTTGRIYASMEALSGETTRATIIANSDGDGIPVGERFSYEISLQDLALKVVITRADGRQATLSRQIDPAYAGLNLYFKAGVYNQNNTGELTDYAQATFFALRQSH